MTWVDWEETIGLDIVLDEVGEETLGEGLWLRFQDNGREKGLGTETSRRGEMLWHGDSGV